MESFSSATVENFSRIVPGTHEKRIDFHKWNVPIFDHFSYEPNLEETPTPPLDFNCIAFTQFGYQQRKISCRLDGNLVLDNDRSTCGEKLTLLKRGASIAWSWNILSEVIGDIYSYIYYFDDEFLTESANRDCSENKVGQSLMINPYFFDIFLKELLKNLFRTLSCAQPVDRLYAETLSKMLSIHLLKNHCVFSQPPKLYENGLRKNALKKVTDYMQDNIDCSVGLDDIAEQLHMSSFHFARLFKQSTGKTPHQYLVERRMERAQELLRYTAMSVTQIAFESGYQSVSSFSNAFRKHCGASPVKYRSSFQP